jgi:hypothetical protein
VAAVTAAVAAVLVAVALAAAIHEEALVDDAAGDRNGDAPRAKNERASGDPTDAIVVTSNEDVAKDGNGRGSNGDDDDDTDDDTDDNGAARNVPATCEIHGLPSAVAAAEAEWRSSGIRLTRTGEADGSNRAPMPAHGL